MKMKSSQWIMAVVLVAAGAMAHATETATFTYDALGRLKKAETAGGVRSGVQQDFVYDAAGNRTSLLTTGPANPHPSPIVPVNASVSSFGAGGGGLTVTVGSATATGTASFTVDGVFVESVQVAGGVARVRIRNIPPGTHSVGVRYSGDGSNDPGTTTFSIVVREISWLPALLELVLQ